MTKTSLLLLMISLCAACGRNPSATVDAYLAAQRDGVTSEVEALRYSGEHGEAVEAHLASHMKAKVPAISEYLFEDEDPTERGYHIDSWTEPEPVRKFPTMKRWKLDKDVLEGNIDDATLVKTRLTGHLEGEDSVTEDLTFVVVHTSAGWQVLEWSQDGD